MRRPTRPTRLAMLALVALGLAACSTPPKTSYYSLGSGIAPERAAADVAPLTVSIGPVTVPDSVDRPQLVVRMSANEVAVLDLHRWIEPLKGGVPRVLAANLSRLLGTQRIAVYPLQTGAEDAVQLRVDVQRFESMPGEGVLLEAQWTVQRSKGEPVNHGHTLVRMATDGPGYEALAAAHARALESMSQEVAQAILNRRAS